jgi:hypothetical protein
LGIAKDNIIIGLDAITNPLNYIKGDISKLESEINDLYGPSLLKLKYKEVLNEYKNIPEYLKMLSIIFRNEFNEIISKFQEGPKETLEGNGPNTFLEAVKVIPSPIKNWEFINPDWLGHVLEILSDPSSYTNFLMEKDSFVLLPEMLNQEKYNKYG